MLGFLSSFFFISFSFLGFLSCLVAEKMEEDRYYMNKISRLCMSFSNQTALLLFLDLEFLDAPTL
ncbi:hypothetical protein V6Z11_A13G196000 [Gossypium hirsutum]